ncbi:NAD(P)-binding protein [Aspergillus crustosus]
MVNVAIAGGAGGTGGMGRAIVDVLQTSASHQAFVFSRKTSTSLANIISVDYSDIDVLVSVLEANNIHTIISTLGITNTSLAVSQLNLIKAATKSRVTKRFVRVALLFLTRTSQATELLPQLRDYNKAITQLRQSGLEWTILHNGIFLDYFDSPALKSYLKPNVFVIDIANKVAAIPGDGDSPVTFTYSFDLAKFVVASLDLDHWEEESRVLGDEMGWNELVCSKFEIHYDNKEKLERFEITELPGHKVLYENFHKERFQWFMAIFELFTLDGTPRIEKAGSLNEKFPGIKPFGIRDLLDRYWRDT